MILVSPLLTFFCFDRNLFNPHLTLLLFLSLEPFLLSLSLFIFSLFIFFSLSRFFSIFLSWFLFCSLAQLQILPPTIQMVLFFPDMIKWMIIWIANRLILNCFSLSHSFSFFPLFLFPCLGSHFDGKFSCQPDWRVKWMDLIQN